MNQKNSGRDLLSILTYLLCLIVVGVLTVRVGGSLAKYVSKGSGSDDARTAKWVIDAGYIEEGTGETDETDETDEVVPAVESDVPDVSGVSQTILGDADADAEGAEIADGAEAGDDTDNTDDANEDAEGGDNSDDADEGADVGDGTNDTDAADPESADVPKITISEEKSQDYRFYVRNYDNNAVNEVNAEYQIVVEFNTDAKDAVSMTLTPDEGEPAAEGKWSKDGKKFTFTDPYYFSAGTKQETDFDLSLIGNAVDENTELDINIRVVANQTDKTV
jgi:hypothetical protein